MENNMLNGHWVTEVENAKYRFPSDIRWGNGYINGNDGYKYFFAETYYDAVEFMLHFSPSSEEDMLQIRISGKWVWADATKS